LDFGLKTFVKGTPLTTWVQAHAPACNQVVLLFFSLKNLFFPFSLLVVMVILIQFFWIDTSPYLGIKIMISFPLLHFRFSSPPITSQKKSNMVDFFPPSTNPIPEGLYANNRGKILPVGVGYYYCSKCIDLFSGHARLILNLITSSVCCVKMIFATPKVHYCFQNQELTT